MAIYRFRGFEDGNWRVTGTYCPKGQPKRQFTKWVRGKPGVEQGVKDVQAAVASCRPPRWKKGVQLQLLTVSHNDTQQGVGNG